MRDRIGLCFAQSVGLSFAARFRHGFRKVGEHDGEPQPKCNLNSKKEVSGTRDRILDNVNRR
jgi:hypothetical protein